MMFSCRLVDLPMEFCCIRLFDHHVVSEPLSCQCEKNAAPEQSCTSACSALGSTCNADATAALSDIAPMVEYLGGGTCLAVDDDTSVFAPYYFVSPTVCKRSTRSTASCSAASASLNVRRICFCGVPFHGWTMGAQGTVMTKNCNWIF